MRQHHPTVRLVPAILAAVAAGVSATGGVTTVVTDDPGAIAAALHPSGLAITLVRVRNGEPVQFGSFSGFDVPPVTLADGLVMSTGSVASLGPNPGAQDPDYSPAAPPEYLTTDLGSGRTGEFHEYALASGAIGNYLSVNDVACIEVRFELAVPSNVKFDFVFGSIEYPVWTNAYTDAFVAFLDDRLPTSQICFDSTGAAIQVGQSFADLVTVDDANTAFSNPHGLIRNLTTTTPMLEAGPHTIWFEVGDINDGIIDSAVFITNLRAEAGDPGTAPSNPGNDRCAADFDRSGAVDGADLGKLLSDWGAAAGQDLTGDGAIDGADLGVLLSMWGPCGG